MSVVCGLTISLKMLQISFREWTAIIKTEGIREECAAEQQLVCIAILRLFSDSGVPCAFMELYSQLIIIFTRPSTKLGTCFAFLPLNSASQNDS
jgi:hypothetical protein